jgi:DGQHR domain-containing protein
MHNRTAKIFNCLKVTQNVGSFYLIVAPASEILPFLTVERRGLSPSEQMKVQRALDPKRQKEISQYLIKGDATFPTSVTVNADSEFIHLVDNNGQLKIIFGKEIPCPDEYEDPREIADQKGDKRWFIGLPEDLKPAEIIDGQHRIEGLKLAIRNAKHSETLLLETLNQFEIPLAVMFDLTPEACARVFVTINSTQRKVDSSHISDLFALSTARSPKRTCHLIAQAVNKMEGGPFDKGLKMLGKRDNDSEFLSQGSFCKYLLKLISRSPEADERALEFNEKLKADSALPFRSLFINMQDALILTIVHNFFTAVQVTYPQAWKHHPDQYLLRKTVGFSAMIGLLKYVATVAVPARLTSVAAFHSVMKQVEQQVPEDQWRVGAFSSSEAEAGKMTRKMIAAVDSNLENLLNEPPN